MEWLLPLLGGLGAGTLITKIADHFLSRNSASRDLIYKEKRETYLGLLDAIKQVNIAPRDLSNQKNFGLWHLRVQLFGSKICAEAVQKMKDSAPDSKERDQYFDEMIEAMRVDLNIDKATPN